MSRIRSAAKLLFIFTLFISAIIPTHSFAGVVTNESTLATYTTINSALASAGAGQILHASGTFIERDIVWPIIANYVTLRGDGMGSTIISGEGADGFSDNRGISVEGDVSLTLEALTIFNCGALEPASPGGTGESGGAVFHPSSQGLVSIISCEICSNESGNAGGPVSGTGGDGGGVYTAGDFYSFGSHFHNNYTGNGDAMPSGRGAGIYTGGTCTMDGCTVSENHCLGIGHEGNGDGGGVYTVGGGTFRNCSFVHNVLDGAAYLGSGAGLYSLGPCYLSGDLFQNNRVEEFNDVIEGSSAADCAGAGAYIGSLAQFNMCTFDSNSLSLDPARTGNGGCGGGVYVLVGAMFVNCSFLNNSSGFGSNVGGSGGAIFSTGEVSASGCLFNGNRACGSSSLIMQGGFGGAISAGGLLLSNSVFMSNVSGSGTNQGGDGGAVYTSGPITADSCVFSGNSAGDSKVAGNGGAVSSGSAWLSRCAFNGNTAGAGTGTGGGGSGGACIINGDAFIVSSSFESNVAGAGHDGGQGGGIEVSGTSTVTNCVFVKNKGGSGTGGGNGGAIDTGAGFVTNCSFLNNAGGTRGIAGGIYFNSGSNSVVNCILWGDTGYTTGKEIYDQGTALDLRYNDVCSGEGGIDGPYTYGTGNISDEPLYVSEIAPYDLHLVPFSPCVNKGTAAGAPSVDIYGVARPWGAGIDMGAYETVIPGPTLEAVYVNGLKYITGEVVSSTVALRVNLASFLGVASEDAQSDVPAVPVPLALTSGTTFDGYWEGRVAMGKSSAAARTITVNASDPLGDASVFVLRFDMIGGAIQVIGTTLNFQILSGRFRPIQRRTLPISSIPLMSTRTCP